MTAENIGEEYRVQGLAMYKIRGIKNWQMPIKWKGNEGE